MGHVLMNRTLWYAVADTLNLPMYVGEKRTMGKKDMPIRIGNMIWNFPMNVTDVCQSGEAVGVLVQGPGDMLLICLAEKVGIKTLTHIFIVNKAKISPVTAFPETPSTITPQILKALYGPSVALHAFREMVGNKPEDWQIA